jgi:hypothetical protein
MSDVVVMAGDQKSPQVDCPSEVDPFAVSELFKSRTFGSPATQTKSQAETDDFAVCPDFLASRCPT